MDRLREQLIFLRNSDAGNWFAINKRTSCGRESLAKSRRDCVDSIILNWSSLEKACSLHRERRESPIFPLPKSMGLLCWRRSSSPAVKTTNILCAIFSAIFSVQYCLYNTNSTFSVNTVSVLVSRRNPLNSLYRRLECKATPAPRTTSSSHHPTQFLRHPLRQRSITSASQQQHRQRPQWPQVQLPHRRLLQVSSQEL